jgi:hypothetical protein
MKGIGRHKVTGIKRYIGEVKMGTFVNREKELAQIDETIEALQGDHYPLQTPIIEFCGVDGIGKTTLLRQIEERCRAKKVICEKKDIRDISAEDLLESARKLLSQKEPVVIILDSFDTTSEKGLGQFELKLRDLIFASNKICIVLASKSAQRFDNTRSIARKLKIYPLKPLDRENSFFYLNDVGQHLSPELREMIYEWTQGYPLAMDIMVDAFLKKPIDVNNLQDKKDMITTIVDSVINDKLLSSIKLDPVKLAYFQDLLNVLSFPRSFNLVIMQNLIERFAPIHALKSSLAYITLPNKINQVADIISWEMQRSGYSIDASMRNIFLLKSKIEDPDLYISIHMYLMERNKQFAIEVPGEDRIRYLREFLYHFAKSGTIASRPEALEEELEVLVEKDPSDQFLRFYEEFWQDEDLRDALGLNAKKVITFIRKRFIELYKNIPEGIERFNYLLSFLSHTLPKVLPATSFSISTPERPFLILGPAIRQIIEEEDSAVYVKFYDVLSQDQTLKESLGQDFERILSLFTDSLSGDR